MFARRARAAALPLLLAVVVAGCSASPVHPAAKTRSSTPSSSAHPAASASGTPAPGIDGLPGMPPVTDASNVYADAGANMLSATAKTAKPMVYVPHSGSGDVWE